MLNRIAVCFRGHVRTFRLIYPHIFNFYENLAKNVDYYFITWQGSQVNTNIAEIFQGRNLVASVALRPDRDFGADSYKSSSYLAYILLPYKHAKERQVHYDLVFDTRPDVFPAHKPNAPLFSPESNTLYVTGFDLHHNFRYKFFDVAVQDWMMAMSSKVYDQMAERFIRENDQGVQISVRTYANDHNIDVNLMPYRGYMIRPNIMDCMKNNEVDPKTDFHKKISEWINLPSERKIEYCMKLGVQLSDYETGSTTCSI